MITRVARDGFARFVGFGRGIWLFPLDTMFRTVGLRYGWLKALFIATPAPLMRGIGRLPRVQLLGVAADVELPMLTAPVSAAGLPPTR